MNVLVFCAHPDDEVIAMGGTLRLFAQMGAKIRLVIFSAGAEGYGQREDKATITQTRQKEVEAVCDILGIAEYFNLQGLDWNLRVSNEGYRHVIHHIRQFKPDVVFTHTPSDYNDHFAVSQTATEGWFHATLACAMEDEPVWKHVPLFEFEVIKPIARPTHVVDISRTYAFKEKAMEVYSSQFGVVGSIFQLMEGRALERGYTAGVQYGEAFLRSNYRPRTIRHLTSMLEKE